jgi:hypothetical protein
MDVIDLEDRTYCARTKLDAACKRQDLIVEDGTVDFSHNHPVLLRRQGDRYQVVHGFRRLEAARTCSDVKRVTCLVLGNLSEKQAVIIAARINLHHGKMLSPKEKREAFCREYEARGRTGSENISDRAWAKVYGVAPNTIKNWRGRSKGSERPEKSRKSAQHSGEAPGGTRKTAHPQAEAAEAASVDRDPERSGDTGPGGAPESAPKVLKLKSQQDIDRLITQLRTSVQIFRDGVDGRALSDKQRAAVTEVIRQLQEMASPPQTGAVAAA